jgi:hypothetical protein
LPTVVVGLLEWFREFHRVCDNERAATFLVPWTIFLECLVAYIVPWVVGLRSEKFELELLGFGV